MHLKAVFGFICCNFRTRLVDSLVLDDEGVSTFHPGTLKYAYGHCRDIVLCIFKVTKRDLLVNASPLIGVKLFGKCMMRLFC